jgi:hypothetical protein
VLAPAGGGVACDASFQPGVTRSGPGVALPAMLAAFMSSTSPASAPSPFIHWLRWPYRLLMLAAACAGFAAVWVILAWSNDSQSSWMALLGALDVAWILRLTGWPGGSWRALVGVIATAAIAVLANWGIIAVHLGEVLGFDPLQSALRLGLHHAWLLAQLANGAFDLAMIGLALVLAAFTTR